MYQNAHTVTRAWVSSPPAEYSGCCHSSIFLKFIFVDGALHLSPRNPTFKPSLHIRPFAAIPLDGAFVLLWAPSPTSVEGFRPFQGGLRRQWADPGAEWGKCISHRRLVSVADWLDHIAGTFMCTNASTFDWQVCKTTNISSTPGPRWRLPLQTPIIPPATTSAFYPEYVYSHKAAQKGTNWIYFVIEITIGIILPDPIQGRE